MSPASSSSCTVAAEGLVRANVTHRLCLLGGAAPQSPAWARAAGIVFSATPAGHSGLPFYSGEKIFGPRGFPGPLGLTRCCHRHPLVMPPGGPDGQEAGCLHGAHSAALNPWQEVM